MFKLKITIIMKNTLKNYDVNKVYKTNDYGMFRYTEGNRSGLVKRRVNKFVKLIKERKFIPEVSIIEVNKDGYVIDGHHRLEALKKTDNGVYFIITDSPRFNDISHNELLNNIALINSSINSMWTKEDHFASAIQSGIPIAVKLQKVKDELIEKFKLNKYSVSINDLYGILKKDIKTYGTKISRNELDKNGGYDEIFESDRFKDDVAFYGILLSYFKNTPYRSYKIIKEIFKQVWSDDVNFNKKRFYENMVKDGYKVHDDTVEEHRREINRLNTKKRRGRKSKKEETSNIADDVLNVSKESVENIVDNA